MTARGETRNLNSVFLQLNDVPIIIARYSFAREIEVIGAERTVPVRKIFADA
jgi:hypothetical protein